MIARVARHLLDRWIAPFEQAAKAEGERLELERRALDAERRSNFIQQLIDELDLMQPSYQERTADWVTRAFGREVLLDKQERSHRFFEEACELVQASGLSYEWALKLLCHVYNRPAGEVHQEMGGVMTTLHSLAEAHGINAAQAGETELARINTPEAMHKVRLKHTSKPKHSPLPGTA